MYFATMSVGHKISLSFTLFLMGFFLKNNFPPKLCFDLKNHFENFAICKKFKALYMQLYTILNYPIVDKDAHKCNAFPVNFYHRHYTHKVKNIIVLFIIFLTKMSNVHSTLTSFLYIQYISKKKKNLKLLITGIYETTWLSIITVALQHTKETIYMYRKVYQI